MNSKHLITGLFLLSVIPSTAADSNINDSLLQHQNHDNGLVQKLPTDDNWWKTFNDPLLDSLIAEGIENNYNILIAARRMGIAQQSLNAARSQYFPTLKFSGSWNKSRLSGLTDYAPTKASTSDYFSIGLNMSWQIDLFGKIKEQARGKKAQWQVSQAQYAGAMVTLCANIAKTYIQLRTWQAELLVAQEHISYQQKIVKLTEARHKAGIASMLDVTQARLVYYSTCASVPSLETSISSAIGSLATLIGVYPEKITGLISQNRHLPEFRQIISTEIPTELLRRRPDIAEAEYQIASDAATLGISKKEYLPTFTLNGSIGTEAHSINNLFENRSITYTIAPTLTLNIFDGFSRHYNTIAAREQMEASIASYNLTVMTAIEETDNAITSYLNTLRHIDLLDKVIEQSQKSLDLSLDLYKRGLSPFSNVVDALMSMLENRNSLIVAHGQALTSLIELYEAIGGGWSIDNIK